VTPAETAAGVGRGNPSTRLFDLNHLANTKALSALSDQVGTCLAQ
jgi:hypothetical protein